MNVAKHEYINGKVKLPEKLQKTPKQSHKVAIDNKTKATKAIVFMWLLK